MKYKIIKTTYFDGRSDFVVQKEVASMKRGTDGDTIQDITKSWSNISPVFETREGAIKFIDSCYKKIEEEIIERD